MNDRTKLDRIIDEEDFKYVLKQWYWALNEYNDWDNPDFKAVMDKYGYTLKGIL